LLNPDAYFFNFYALPNIVVSSLIFLTGLFVFAQNPKSSSNRFFFLFCLSLNLWLYGRAIMYCSKESSIALGWAKTFAKMGVFNISPLVYTFSVHWLGLYEKQKKFVIASFLGSFFFYAVTLTTPYGLTGVRHYFWGYYPVYGLVCKIFLVFFFGYFLAAFRNFFVEWRKAQDPVRRQQIKVVTLAYIISFTGAVDFLPKIVNLSMYPFGYLSVCIWTFIMGYAIVRYRTMDIQTVVHKTIMWFIASVISGTPFVLLFYFARPWFATLPTFTFAVVILGLFSLFTLYARQIQPKIDHLFQRRRWDMMKALERFTDELVHLRTVDEVIAHIIGTVKEVFYVSHTSILLRGNNDKFFKGVGHQQPNSQKLSMENAFFKWLEANDRVVMREYVDLDPRMTAITEEAKAYLKQVNSQLCVPFIVNQRLIGILNLSDKDNLQPYRADDISFLTDLRRSASIALSNAFHIIAMQESLRKWNEELEKKVDERTKQLQDTQAQLVQAEKLATIGTLAGGVAHEINNPLAAVLLNAQMLKMSAGPEDVELIDSIEEGAKRCQSIVQNLLKYSRKSISSDEVGPFQVNNVVKSVCSLLAYQFSQENIKLETNCQNSAVVLGVSNEIEQVLTNLLLNAKDAVQAAKRNNGCISVMTREGSECVDVIVVDNGLGIKKEVREKIFDPFYTTKEIGKGTGLGLSISQGIVEKHGGKIIVQSDENKGATFIVRFPIFKKKQQNLK
jgi:signal transduction histidine kinase